MKKCCTLFGTTILAAVYCSLAFTGLVAATQSAQNTAPSSKSPAAVPVTMTECEGINNCATWTFLGIQGNGQWPSGAVANLSVENFDADTVVIRRADSTGASAGLTAVYKGTRHGDRIGGEFLSSWPGHWDNVSGNWYATIGKAAQSLPSVIHFCALNCNTWIWDNGHYVNTTGAAGTSILTVESFTRESVIIHRTDNPPGNGTAVIVGQISDQGNSIVNGRITWTSGVTGTFPFSATWGTALNTLPGQDGPVPTQRVIVRPSVVCFPWFFGIVCG